MSTQLFSHLLCSILLVCNISVRVSAQNQTAERTAQLEDANYAIDGQAHLRAFDDGSLSMVLSDNFNTPVGPDVRVYLNNSISLSGAVQIANLSDLNHFSGGLTVDVPDGIGINDYDFLVFYCVSFNLLWATGDFGEPANEGDPNVCTDHATATTGWVTLVDICPTDGLADSLELRNSIGGTVGENYAYLLTDTNEMLLEVIQDSIYDFEGTGDATLRVYGISYNGDLDPAIGANRMQTTATGCYAHSRSDLYLSVTKNACATFTCQESLTASFAWVTEVDNCATDGEDDMILIQNNIMTPPGDHYAFLLTDSDQNLIEIILDSFYNFEGAGTEELRVYGLSYDGELSPAVGEHRSQTTASSCYIHSGDNLYLTIFQTAACATSVVDQSLSDELMVYPNPAQSELYLDLPTAISWRELEVVDMLGRQVLTLGLDDSSLNNSPIDISMLDRGMYSLRLFSTDGKAAVKVFQVSR